MADTITPHELDDATWAILEDPIHRTWCAIAADVFASADYPGAEEIDNLSALESVIDANRLSMFGGEEGVEADELISALCRKFDYLTVLKWCASKVTYA